MCLGSIFNVYISLQYSFKVSVVISYSQMELNDKCLENIYWKLICIGLFWFYLRSSNYGQILGYFPKLYPRGSSKVAFFPFRVLIKMEGRREGVMRKKGRREWLERKPHIKIREGLRQSRKTRVGKGVGKEE